MKLRALLLLVLSAAWGMHAFAQEDRGRISGVVTDTTGAVIPKANVTVTDEATHVSQTVHSNDTGQYVVDLLIPDLYTVRVDAQGFKQFTATHVRLEIAGRGECEREARRRRGERDGHGQRTRRRAEDLGRDSGLHYGVSLDRGFADRVRQ